MTNIKGATMRHNSKKFTFRQKWFPTMNDADQIAGYRNGMKSFLGRWARSIVILGTLIGLPVMQWGNNTAYSEGQRVGVVNKISEKGVIWKTKEGELSLEGRSSTGDDMGAGRWEFSIDGRAYNGENTRQLYEDIKKCMDNGKKVKITYKQPLLKWPWRGSTDYFVQSVEPLERK